MLARIEAVGRFLGHAPKPVPARRYDKREENPDKRETQQRRYLRELQQQAAHSTPETLILSRRKFNQLRKLALQRAYLFWALLYPGVKVKPGQPMVLREGSRSTQYTQFQPAGGKPGFTLVETEDRFEGEAGVSVWFALRVQCVLGDQRQFGI